LKFYQTGIIASLPKIVGVQSVHANPVYRYYQEADPARRQFLPVTVQASVAQAAMIGNPVSMPRVIHLVHQYNQAAGSQRVFFVEVAEQDIMDWQLRANRSGHVACTHGGESLAGLVTARQLGYVERDDVAILDSTAHAIKFSGFQEMYFENRFPDEFEVCPDAALVNLPELIRPENIEKFPAPGKPLSGDDFDCFVKAVSQEIADKLNLKKV
jgi:threonine synthase